MTIRVFQKKLKQSGGRLSLGAAQVDFLNKMQVALFILAACFFYAKFVTIHIVNKYVNQMSCHRTRNLVKYNKIFVSNSMEINYGTNY